MKNEMRARRGYAGLSPKELKSRSESRHALERVENFIERARLQD